MKESGTYIMMQDLSILQGKNISEVAREMGMSRTTVRQLLKNGHHPHASIGKPRASKLDLYKPYIQLRGQAPKCFCNIGRASLLKSGGTLSFLSIMGISPIFPVIRNIVASKAFCPDVDGPICPQIAENMLASLATAPGIK